MYNIYLYAHITLDECDAWFHLHGLRRVRTGKVAKIAKLKYMSQPGIDQLLNGIRRQLSGSKISSSSTRFVCLGPIGKRLPLILIGWDYSSITADLSSTEPDRQHDHNVLYQVCGFQTNRKTKKVALTTDWLRFFDSSFSAFGNDLREPDRKQMLNVRYQVSVFGMICKPRWPPWPLICWAIWLLLCIHWTEFCKAWEEARSQSHVPFESSDWSDSQDGRPVLWLAEPLALLFCIRWAEFNESWHEANSQFCVFLPDHYKHVFHSIDRYSGARLCDWVFDIPLIKLRFRFYNPHLYYKCLLDCLCFGVAVT